MHGLAPPQGIVTLGGTLDSKAVKVHMKMENGASSAIPVEENLMWDGWGTGQGTEWWHFDVAQNPRDARVGTKFTAYVLGPWRVFVPSSSSSIVLITQSTHYIASRTGVETL